MRFASPVVDGLLDGRHYDTAGAAYYTSPEKLAGDFAPVRYRRELAWFRRFCPRGRVLDVGCNTGAFLHQLRSSHPNDYDLVGLDVSGPALQHAASLGISVSAVPFEDRSDAHKARGPFDAITFWAVLEHVAQPAAFLLRAANLLRPGGHAFIVVPNARSLAMRLLGARYRYVMDEHINWFDLDTLRRLAESVPQLSVIAATTTHFNPVVIWQDARTRRAAVPAVERARLLVQTNAWKQRPATAPLRAAYALTETILGRLGLADNVLLVVRRS